MIAESVHTALSFTQVTVTVCGVSQLVFVNVRLHGPTIHSFVLLLERSILTSLVGSESSTIVYVDVHQFSVVVDHVELRVYPAVSPKKVKNSPSAGLISAQ